MVVGVASRSSWRTIVVPLHVIRRRDAGRGADVRLRVVILVIMVVVRLDSGGDHLFYAKAVTRGRWHGSSSLVRLILLFLLLRSLKFGLFFSAALSTCAVRAKLAGW